MKSILSIMLIVILCFGMIACSAEKVPDQTHPEDDVAGQIYEISSGDDHYHYEWGVFNHQNVISDELVISQEYEKNTAAKYQNKVRSYDLQYVETCFFPLGDRREHKYRVNGIEDSEVLLREDGTISFIHYPIAHLDISRTASFEEVYDALIPAISDLIDLTQFSVYDDWSFHTDTDEGFRDYSFACYRLINGYLTNFALVQVQDDGEVDLLRNENDYTAYEDVCYKIDKEIEEQLIRIRMESIFNTDSTNIITYNLWNGHFEKRLITYNNELCVQYQLECDYYLSGKEEEEHATCELLIPVRLLINSEGEDSSN